MACYCGLQSELDVVLYSALTTWIARFTHEVRGCSYHHGDNITIRELSPYRALERRGHIRCVAQDFATDGHR